MLDLIGVPSFAYLLCVGGSYEKSAKVILHLLGGEPFRSPLAETILLSSQSSNYQFQTSHVGNRYQELVHKCLIFLVFRYLIILYEQACMMIVMMKVPLQMRTPAASAMVFL